MRQPNIELQYYWECFECNEGALVSMIDVVDIGTPICGLCGEDMSLLPTGATVPENVK